MLVGWIVRYDGFIFGSNCCSGIRESARTIEILFIIYVLLDFASYTSVCEHLRAQLSAPLRGKLFLDWNHDCYPYLSIP